MNGFKFEIGSVVRHVISQNQSSETKVAAVWWGNNPHREIRGIVAGRIADECTAGVQRHYMVRWVRDDGMILHDGLMKHHEIELCASEPFPENKGEHSND